MITAKEISIKHERLRLFVLNVLFLLPAVLLYMELNFTKHW